jgi:hypothetical protein
LVATLASAAAAIGRNLQDKQHTRQGRLINMLAVGDGVRLAVCAGGAWRIIAGSDDKIISVRGTTHNIPAVPQLLRALWTTALTTAALPFSTRW